MPPSQNAPLRQTPQTSQTLKAPHGAVAPPGREVGGALVFKPEVSATQWPVPAGRAQRHGRRRLKRQRRPGQRRVIFVISLVLAGIGLAGAYKRGLIAVPEAIAAHIPPASDVVQAVGLGLDQVAITGYRFTSDEAIFKALDLDKVRSLWAFDPKAARLRLEELPWVDSADVTRVYPGQLDVRITERTPFALWRHEGREELIDNSGRVLQAVPAGSVTHLPVVAGEGAARQAGNLMVLLARYQPLASSITSAERVNGRRWSLHLITGGRIELPADGEASAISELEANGQLSSLLSGPPTIIDLRAPDRMAIRPAEGALAASRQRNLAGIGSRIEKNARYGGQP